MKPTRAMVRAAVKGNEPAPHCWHTEDDGTSVCMLSDGHPLDHDYVDGARVLVKSDGTRLAGLYPHHANAVYLCEERTGATRGVLSLLIDELEERWYLAVEHSERVARLVLSTPSAKVLRNLGQR